MIEPPDGLTQVARLVDQRVAAVLADQRDQWKAVDPRLAEALTELSRMAEGGKRLRAAFCYWGWLGASGGDVVGEADDGRVVDVCAAFELLQAFALIHDDIMDDADTRRGEQTIHTHQAEKMGDRGWRGEPRRYGDGVAILVGDLSHVYADQLVGNASPETRQLWDQLRIELNLGQFLDMRAAAASDLDAETASRVAIIKSALYTIVRPLQVGASLAGPPSADLLAQLEAYGRPAGRAFQLRDDLLDVLGDTARVGKPVGSDLREGKPTELLAIARERASTRQLEVLERVGASDLGAVGTAEIISVLQETGAIPEIEQRIGNLIGEATAVARDLPFSSVVIETLIAFANYVAARTY